MSARILVVDDEEPVSSMLKVVLEANGYSVVTASSAAQAVNMLAANEPFQVVLTDMKMENDTAGYEVVRAAKALPEAPGVVILTAYPLLAQDWRAAGADAAMSKPTQMALLLDLVEDLIRKTPPDAKQSS